MITIRTRDDLRRWVEEAWGDDDEPETLPERQAIVVLWLCDIGRDFGARMGDDWAFILEHLAADWRDVEAPAWNDEWAVHVMGREGRD